MKLRRQARIPTRTREYIPVTVSPEEKELVSKLAERYDRSRIYVMRVALEELLIKEGLLPPDPAEE